MNGISDMVVADFNGDGKPDLAAVDSNGNVIVLLGNGNGTFQPPTTVLAGVHAGPLAVGDFNGDGKPDLAVVEFNFNLKTPDSVQILLGNGDGTFKLGPQTVLPLAKGIVDQGGPVVADFNGDGKPDLAVAYLTQIHPNHARIVTLLGNGDGTFSISPVVNLTVGASSLVVADLNGDGKPDIAAQDYSVQKYTGRVYVGLVVELGNGDGTFHSLKPVPLSLGFYDAPMVAADFNGDGHPDLAISGVTILRGKGDGTFSAAANYTGGGALAVGDFDGDGAPDLVASTTGSVAVLLNQTSRLAISGPALTFAGKQFQITVTALDHNNNPLSTYRGTVHFTSSDGRAVLPKDYTFTTKDNGVHTFTVILKTAGSQSITGTDTQTSSTAGMTSVKVNPSFVTHFLILGPSSVTAATPFTISVTAKDAYGNRVTGYRGTVQFSSSDPGAMVPAPYPFTATDAGTHTFSITLNTAGTQAVTVSDSKHAAIKGSISITVSGPVAPSLAASLRRWIGGSLAGSELDLNPSLPALDLTALLNDPIASIFNDPLLALLDRTLLQDLAERE